MRSRIGLIVGVLAAAALTAGAALARADTAQGLVTVDIDGVRDRIATETGLDAAGLPATVMVAPGVAARLCAVEASTLSPAGTDDGAACRAVSTDEGFNAALKQQLEGRAGAASARSDEAKPKAKELRPLPA